MRPRPKSPSFLVLNPHSYCFRMVVPKDLQRFVGKRELFRESTDLFSVDYALVGVLLHLDEHRFHRGLKIIVGDRDVALEVHDYYLVHDPHSVLQRASHRF
ncbi:MAG: hypothetical protein WAL90_17785 [Desulfobacterales bacterium]